MWTMTEHRSRGKEKEKNKEKEKDQYQTMYSNALAHTPLMHTLAMIGHE